MTAARPFPLPEDAGVGKARPSVYLARAAAAHLRAFTAKSTPERCAEQMFGRDVVTLEILRRSATAPAMTSVSGWAKELAEVAIYDAIQSITSISAAADLIDRGLKLSMDGIAELRVPGRVLNAAAAGAWVAEDAPAPARQLSFVNAAILRPRKLRVDMAFTREQEESSNIVAILQRTFEESAGWALDAQMFSATACDAAKPPGLFVGTAALTPVAGGGDNAMHGDLANLFGALAVAGGGKTAAVIAAAPQAMRLKASLGPLWDYPILAASALAAGTVAVVEIASFVSGFSPTPEFKVGKDAALHFEDTTPADPIMGGVPVRSMFQIDATALKLGLWAAWGLRAAGHAQWISGATW